MFIRKKPNKSGTISVQVLQKKKGGRLVKDTIEQMLSCLHNDILTLTDLPAGEFCYRLDCLRKGQHRFLDATMKMYFQQLQMFRTGEHSCKDRIVSIFQPYIRPIVQGKASVNVEFGAKKSVVLYKFFSSLDARVACFWQELWLHRTYLTLGNEKKTYFSFAFPSFFRNFVPKT